MELSRAEFLLGQSERRLLQRDFSGCRSFAIQALQSDGKLTVADQLLAVADIFIASLTTTPICNSDTNGKNPSPNYYSILQLSSRTQDSKLINQHYKKLVLLVHPIKHKSAIAADAYSLLDEAWSVLSNPKKKAQFDSDLAECYLNKHVHCGNADGSFWTACPYCYCVYEYERVYVDCCLRCLNCKRPFHGLVIPPPPPSLVIPGKDEYYCCLGVYPLGFCAEGENGIGEKIDVMQVDSEGSVGNNSSGEKLAGNVGINESEKVVKSSCERKSGEAEKRPKRRRKVVATHAKKITGTGNRVKRNVEARNEGGIGEAERGSSAGVVIDGVEYFEGDNEIFVGLEILNDDDM